ncbi:hypothetical protein E4U21_005748 [Claviceps maximensis]|nr:hypothetical protein E4U21_005748 [Claviceps maximensis]
MEETNADINSLSGLVITPIDLDENIQSNASNEARMSSDIVDDAQRPSEEPSSLEPAWNSLGQLERLPSELLVELLLHCHLSTVRTFRLVNRRASNLVESIQELKVLMKELAEFSSIKTPSCKKLLKILSTGLCSKCKTRFGCYFNVQTYRLFCGLCVTLFRAYRFKNCRPRFRALIREYGSGFFAPTWTRVRNVSFQYHHIHGADAGQVSPMPGCYCVACARDDGAENTITVIQPTVPCPTRLRVPLFLDLMRVPREPWNNPHYKQKRKHVARYCQVSYITAPYLPDPRGQVDWGYYCLGCEKDILGDVEISLRGRHTREGMLKHIEEFGPIEPDPNFTSAFIHVQGPTTTGG